MARPIYSTSFIYATTIFGGTPSKVTYVVPGTHRAIIRTWTFGKTATPAARSYLLAGPAAADLLAVIDLPVVGINSSTVQFNGLVIPPGGSIAVQAVAGSGFHTVSGYLLAVT